MAADDDLLLAPVDDRSRLRDAFAQLLAQKTMNPVPPEAAWALQGHAQLPGSPGYPREDLIRDAGEADPSVNSPIRQFNPNPDFDYPTALPGRGMVGYADLPAPGYEAQPPEKPFHGKGEYALPETPKKKKSKKGKD